MSVVLGDHHPLLGLTVFDCGHGSHIGQVVGADDHAARVDACLPIGVFQFLSINEH